MNETRVIPIANIRGWIYKFLADGFKYPAEENRARLPDKLRKIFFLLKERVNSVNFAMDFDFEILLDELQKYQDSSMDEQLYIQLFDLNPMCPMGEGSYDLRGRSKNRLLWEFSSFYKQAGLGMKEHSELPDHIGVKLEFMQYLTYFEEKEDIKSDSSLLKRCLELEIKFLKMHLIGWIDKFIEKLEWAREKKSKETGFYLALANLSSYFFRKEKEYVSNLLKGKDLICEQHRE